MTATQTKFEIRRDFGGVKFLAVITVIKTKTLWIYIVLYELLAIISSKNKLLIFFWFA